MLGLVLRSHLASYMQSDPRFSLNSAKDPILPREVMKKPDRAFGNAVRSQAFDMDHGWDDLHGLRYEEVHHS